jgi:hypothetical protein
MRARYYEPNTGRFISEDPATDGENWFSYVHNSPINFFDPSGKTTESSQFYYSIGTLSALAAIALLSCGRADLKSVATLQQGSALAARLSLRAGVELDGAKTMMSISASAFYMSLGGSSHDLLKVAAFVVHSFGNLLSTLMMAQGAASSTRAQFMTGIYFASALMCIGAMIHDGDIL